MFSELNFIQLVAVWALPLIFAITVHEVAHGWVADKLGDTTARQFGRLSLNPIKHIDPVGTIAVPLVLMALSSGFLFGWAKPVPVNFSRLHNPRRDVALVALAGPGANLIMALLWILVFKLGVTLQLSGVYLAEPMQLMAYAGVLINVVLLVLNLIPVPPLDGGRVALSLLPPRQAMAYAKVEPYGIFIVLGILLLGGLEILLNPVMNLFIEFMRAIL